MVLSAWRYWVGCLVGRYGLVVIVLLCLLFAAVACATSDSGDGPEAATLTIAIYPSGCFSTSLFVARDREYFDHEGISVRFKECESGAAAVDELLAGRVDLACAADYVLANDAMTHPEVRAVSELFSSTTLIKLVARRDRGIKAASDLVGKTVATPEGTAGHYYLEQSLAVNGIETGVVDVVFRAPGELNQALRTGEVDAVSIWEPLATDIADDLDGGSVSLDGQAGQRLYFLLIGLDQWLTSHPGDVHAILRALLKAEEFMFENSDDAIAIVARATKQPETTLAVSWEQFHFGITLSEGLRAALASELDWLSSSHEASGPQVAPLSLMDFRGLEEVAPDAISVLR